MGDKSTMQAKKAPRRKVLPPHEAVHTYQHVLRVIRNDPQALFKFFDSQRVALADRIAPKAGKHEDVHTHDGAVHYWLGHQEDTDAILLQICINILENPDIVAGVNHWREIYLLQYACLSETFTAHQSKVASAPRRKHKLRPPDLLRDDLERLVRGNPEDSAKEILERLLGEGPTYQVRDEMLIWREHDGEKKKLNVWTAFPSRVSRAKVAVRRRFRER